MTLRCWQEYIPWSIGRTQQSSVLSKPDPLQLSSPQTRPEVLIEYLTCINFIPFSQLQQSSSWGCFIFKVNRQKIFQTNVDRGVVDTLGFGQIQNTIGCGEVCLHHWLWKCADLTTVKTCVHCSCIDPTVQIDPHYWCFDADCYRMDPSQVPQLTVPTQEGWGTWLQGPPLHRGSYRQALVAQFESSI